MKSFRKNMNIIKYEHSFDSLTSNYYFEGESIQK